PAPWRIAESPRETICRVERPAWLSPTATGCLLRLAIVPRARRTEVVGSHGDHLKVKVAAPPVDDAANDALIDFLADLLGVTRARIGVKAGRTGRRKVVAVDG